MSLFSFYREATPEPPTLEIVIEDSREDEFDADFSKYSSQVNLTFFGTPDLRPQAPLEDRAFSPESYSSVDPFELDSFEIKADSSGTQSPVEPTIDFKAATQIRNLQDYRTSEATTLCLTTGPMAIPVEIWEMIFCFVSLDADDDSFQRVDDLLSCALACRVWSMIALPMLYRTHGWGVFMPRPANRGSKQEYFSTARCIDFYTDTANWHMLKLWRTLLLSCFTASRPTSASRFTTFTGATLFPYITYVHNLDTRTLVMVLSGIMKSQARLTKRCPEIDESAQFFFSGALGAFEISGDVRGDRMIVGGPEYRVQSPMGGKEVKLFVGDTALMIMDFLYPHLTHLKGFTIPELGQLRVHSPITMSHPGDLINSLSSLNSLVISSGWMVSAGLGKAIASIRPSLLGRRNTSAFNLTILDWRFKTHYDPDYHHEEDWEANREDYRWTQRSACDFFNALNPNSVTSMDLDFEVRYNRQQQGDLGGGTIAIRQSKSLKAFRLSHLRTTDQKLQNMFRHMAAAGFRPISLRLEDIYNESEGSLARERWNFPRGMFDDLEDLQLSRFSGMFDLLVGVIRREDTIGFTNGGTSNCLAIPQPLKSLKLHYHDKHVRESPAEAFILNTIPALSHTLTFLKLVDTDHDLCSTVAPRRRTYYDAIYHHVESPLESLVNLRTLVLTGDVSAFLIGRRLPQIMKAIEGTIEAMDLCVSLIDLSANDLTVFAGCRRMEKLILREWSWDMPSSPPSPYGIPTTPITPAPTGMNYPGSPFYPPIRRLTVEVIKRILIEGTAVLVGPSSREVHRKLVLKYLGITGGLLEVAGEEHWGELKEWAEKRGTRFRWHPAELTRI